jgi:small subunit ribosomal protein S20
MDECDGTPSQVSLRRLILEREMKNMPNIKSAKKRVKVIETKTLQNKIFKTQLKTDIKKYEAALEAGDVELAKVTYKAAVKKIDQAAACGIIHKNAAARKKSQFTKKLNAIG